MVFTCFSDEELPEDVPHAEVDIDNLEEEIQG